MILLYSVSSGQEVSYRSVLEESGATVVLISPEPILELPDHWTAVTGSRIDEALLRRAVPDISRRHVYVSGPPNMVSGVGSAARRLEAASVRTDFFSGY